MFTTTLRSQKSKSGLDYSKTVIIKDTDYLDTATTAIVDRDDLFPPHIDKGYLINLSR